MKTNYYSTRNILRSLFVTCLLMAGMLTNSFAQVSGYTYSQSSLGYTPISGGTLLGTTSSDDQYFVTTVTPAGGTTTTGIGFPIGFTFTYNSIAYDRVGINNNGWISLGQSSLGATAVDMASTSAYAPLASTSSIVPTLLRARIAGIGADMAAKTGSSLRIQTIGLSPFQQCIIQWSGYQRFGAAHALDIINFQIILNEAGGVASAQTVQVSYGSNVWGPLLSSVCSYKTAIPSIYKIDIYSQEIERSIE